jgi:hypothetical protein
VTVELWPPDHRHSFAFVGHGAGRLVYQCDAETWPGRICDVYNIEPCEDCDNLEPGHVDGFAQLLQRCAVCQLWQDYYCDAHLREDRRVICPACCGWPCCKGL